MVAGAYAAALSGAILLGTIVSMGGSEEYPRNAVRMPLVSILIALALGGAALGLFRKNNIGRFLFLLIAPWGSIALGSAFAPWLWQQDVPYTALAIFVYVPLAFLLARGSALHAVGAKDSKWVSRGGALVLACAATMLLTRIAVAAAKPSSGGSFIGGLIALNEYVKRLVLCDVSLWNYIIASIAVSIPTSFRAEENAQGTPVDGDSA
jgi:hypothetical protein